MSGNRPTPLHELRVGEISDRIAGGYCGRLLLDARAQVHKVEPPQGDSLRRYTATRSPVPDGPGGIGAARYPCPAFARLAGQRRWLHLPPPTLGEHNEEVLGKRCGLTAEELARLAAEEVIGTRPKGA